MMLVIAFSGSYPLEATGSPVAVSYCVATYVTVWPGKILAPSPASSPCSATVSSPDFATSGVGKSTSGSAPSAPETFTEFEFSPLGKTGSQLARLLTGGEHAASETSRPAARMSAGSLRTNSLFFDCGASVLGGGTGQLYWSGFR